jgi:hypothetical protein
VKYRGTAIAAVAAIAAAAVVTAIPAQAAGTPGWRLVVSQHYGAAGDISDYETVVAPAAGDAWVFGGTNVSGLVPPGPGTPVAEHWNGTTWTREGLPAGLTGDISTSAALSRKDIWAVDESSKDASVLRWNGTKWSVFKQLPNTAGKIVTDILVLSDTNVWVFGGAGVIKGTAAWHYDGHTWSQPSGIPYSIKEASALSPSDIWGVADKAASNDSVVHYNGKTWQTVNAPSYGTYGRPVVGTGDNVWIISTSQEPGRGTSLVHLSGGKWTTMQVPLPYAWSLVSDGAGGLWMNGSCTTLSGFCIAHRTAAGKWSIIKTPGGSGAEFGDAALVPGTTSLWAAGLIYNNTASSANAGIWAFGPER